MNIIIKCLSIAFIYMMPLISIGMDRQDQISQALKTLTFIDAVKSDDAITVGRLLEANEINHLEVKIAYDKSIMMPPLTYALAIGALKVASKLMEYSPRRQVLLMDSNRDNCLDWAICAGHIQMIPKLIVHGAKINLLYKDYVNACTRLSEDQKRDLLKLLADAEQNDKQRKEKKHQD